jgi:hypothetical protein
MMLCAWSAGEDATRRSTYLECKVDAVAEMNTLKARGVELSANVKAAGIPPDSRTIGCICQSPDRVVRNRAALDQAYSLEFGQLRQTLNRLVGQVCAATQVNVADAVAARD